MTWEKSRKPSLSGRQQHCTHPNDYSELEQKTSSSGKWVAKFVARLLATAALWVRIQTSLKITIWATSAKGVANTL
jgi:ribosomal protein L31E